MLVRRGREDHGLTDDLVDEQVAMQVVTMTARRRVGECGSPHRHHKNGCAGAGGKGARGERVSTGHASQDLGRGPT